MAHTAKDNRYIDPNEWEQRQHELVFDTLEQGIKETQFPTSKEAILHDAGDELILKEPDVTLGPYLETLPDKSYRSEEDVARTLNETWTRAARDIR